MKNKFSMAMSLAVMVAMLFTSLALADTIQSDGDTVTPAMQTTVNLGTVAPGANLTPKVSFQLSCDGNKHVDNGQTVNLSYNAGGSTIPAGGSLSATVASIGSIPVSWPDDGSNVCTGILPLGDNGDSTVTITAPTAGGTYSFVVAYSAALNPAGTNDPASITGAVPTVTYTLTVPSDTTAPVITPNVSGTLGNNGWYTSEVTVSWSVVDNESSISSSSGCDSTTINADTAGTTLTCSATSAGGTSSQSVTIKRDATAPTGVSGAPNRAPDSGTWYNNAVDVVFTGTDAPSGIASCTSTNYSGPDGAGVTVSGSCTDNAGNSNITVASSAFDYDDTAPTAALSVTAGTAGANGWYTSNVTVSTSGADSVSGVTCSNDQDQTTETAGAEFNGSCTNGAGLTTNAAPLTVKLDKTGPSASLSAAGTLGDNNWYTSNVTISTSGSDSISDPTTCTATQSQTTDTASATFNGSCTNNAGLSTAAAPLTITRDATAPVVTVTGVTNGATYTLGSVPAAGCNTTDATSGVATVATLSLSGGPVGSFTAACNGAVDNAGNTNSASVIYTVIYAWNGFFQPVDNLPALNRAKAGSAIPVKFSLGGNQGLDIFAAGYPSSKAIACGSTANADDIESTVTAGSSSLSYDALADQYVYVWKTDKAWAGTCRTLTVKLADGTIHQANFQLTK
jgi:hypothetical protein